MGDAIATFVHLFNRTPTKVLEYKTYSESWSGKESDLSHLRYLIVLPMHMSRKGSWIQSLLGLSSWCISMIMVQKAIDNGIEILPN